MGACCDRLLRGVVKTFTSLCAFVANPGAPTVTPQGTTGSTSSSYVIEAVDANGAISAAGSAGSTSTGHASPNGTNFNRITWAAVPGAASYRIRRTVGYATQGLIGTTASTTFDDTGLTGDGTSSSTTNNTGASDPVECVDWENTKTVQLTGTFAGVDIQGTVDGSTWVTLASMASAGLSNLTGLHTHVRLRATAYSAGTMAGHILGRRQV